MELPADGRRPLAHPEQAVPRVRRCGGWRRNATHAEWTKLRTVAGTGWLLLATVTLTVALSGATAASVTYHHGAGQDPTKISLTGIALGQALVAVLAVQTISGEYTTGMIGTTLAAVPRRPVVLTAKAIVLSGVVLVAGTAAVLGSLLAGRLALPANGFTAAHRHPALSLANGATLRAAAGSVLYLTLVTLLSLGIAATVRDPAAAIGVILGLLYLFPIITEVVDHPQWQRHLRQIGPMTAGLTIQSTTDPHDLPLSAWAGLAVIATWTTASLLTAGLLIRQRDP
jgi:ABC-2 type transport system permease protein